MFKVSLIATLLMAGYISTAQNTNVIDVTKTTKTTIKDSEGEKEIVKEQGIQAVQEIELQDADSKTLNKDIKETPYQVVTSTATKVINPDGTERTVGIDRSGNYSSGGKNFKLLLDATGYEVYTDSNKKIGILRATSSNSYIFRAKNIIAVAYFDNQGNLIVETHNEKTDSITVESYRRI